MGDNRIVNMADPAADKDAVNRQWANLNYINTSGDTMVGTLVTQKLEPSANLTYDIGENGKRYVNVYANRFQGTATTAQSLDAAVTIQLSGDVTGSASFSGAGGINIVTTISNNSVALGTDTTGDYVSTGATSGYGLSGSTTGETQTFTVTSNGTSSNSASTLVFRDGSGNFSAGTVTATFSGNITGTPTVPSITKSGTNGTGDIGQSDNLFGTVYGTAYYAKYGDLAEKYLPDAHYEPGTVVVFGGAKEVTAAVEFMDRRIAGVVATNPAFKMNAELEGGVFIALTGRVPCKVVGKVRKGDMLISSGAPGVATAEKNPAMGSVIGKALEDYDSQTIGVIEVVVGRI
jgi:hypothetical protein